MIQNDTGSNFIIVSNRLPVSVTKEQGKLVFESSSGGLATAMSSVGQGKDKIWIGWPGIASDDLTSADKRTIIKELRKLDCVPVFLTQKQVTEYYDGYANATIWPLFHYFSHHAVNNQTHWLVYQEVNRLFQKTVLRYAANDATLWVHDYHLMLLPRLLRESLPESTIGFFLHIPFPSYEIFRLLPNRAEILRGMLGADLVGFHTYDYVRYFTGSARQALGHDSSLGSVILKNRAVRVDAFPIGIDYQKFTDALERPAVKSELAQLRERYKGQRIIISMDRLDYSKGIVERLEAFGLFLEQNPRYRRKVTLVVIAVPSRTHVDAYKQLRDAIELTVSRINGTYATMDWSPISYQYHNLPFDQIVALYAASDIALVTPLRDGMNLVAKEYIASKQKRPGVLILSEMAGAARELPEALRVNPYDANAIVAALKEALKMPVAKQKCALVTMQARISHYSVERWSNDFMEQLARAKTEANEAQGMKLGEDIREQMLQLYAKAAKRLFLLDYDGTLRDYVSSPAPSQARPTQKLMRALASLTADSRNQVCIISGRSRDALEDWFHGLPVTLVAEHGAWLRIDGQWAQADIAFKEHKEKVKPILERYAERTPGAIIEEKDFALVWHYRNVIHDLAYIRNTNLRHDLGLALDGTDVGVFKGNKIIEIKPRIIHKGTVVEELLAEHNADFIFCAGDDYTDEDMFEAVPESAWTVKVGAGASRARHHLGLVDEVIALLGDISRQE